MYRVWKRSWLVAPSYYQPNTAVSVINRLIRLKAIASRGRTQSTFPVLMAALGILNCSEVASS